MQRIDNNSVYMRFIIMMLIHGDYQAMVSQIKSCLEMGMGLDTGFDLQRSDFLSLMNDYRAIHTVLISDQDVKKMTVMLFKDKPAIQVDLNFMVNLFDKLGVFNDYYQVARDEAFIPSAPPYHLVESIIENLSIQPTAPPLEENIYDHAVVHYTGMKSSILFPSEAPENREAKLNEEIINKNKATICIVGGMCSGKTELLKKFVGADSDKEYPNCFTNTQEISLEFSGSLWNISIRDIESHACLNRGVEQIYYKNADAIMVTLDIYSHSSIKDADKRIQTILDYKDSGAVSSHAIIVLALTKCDLLNKRIISKEEVDSLLNKYAGHIKFCVETAARNSVGVEGLLTTTIQLIDQSRAVIEVNNDEDCSNEGSADTSKRCVIS